MLTRITPAANYRHANEVPANARWLYLFGQVSIAPDGTIPAEAAAQAELCFADIEALLRAADMAPADLVRLTP